MLMEHLEPPDIKDLKSTPFENRLKNDNYFMWLKAAYALMEVKTVASVRVELVSKQQHEDMVKATAGIGEAPPCVCKIKNKKDMKAACVTCKLWADEIERNKTEHGHIHYKNSNPQSWPCSHWDVSKVYMGQLHDQQKLSNGIENFDVVPILQFLCNSKAFALTEKEIEDIKKTKDMRDKVMHNPNHKLNQAKFEECIDCCIDAIKVKCLLVKGVNENTIENANKELLKIKTLKYSDILEKHSKWKAIECASIKNQLNEYSSLLKERTSRVLAATNELLSLTKHDIDLKRELEGEIVSISSTCDDIRTHVTTAVELAKKTEQNVIKTLDTVTEISSKLDSIRAEIIEGKPKPFDINEVRNHLMEAVYSSEEFIYIDHLPDTDFKLNVWTSEFVIPVEKTSVVLDMKDVDAQYCASRKFKPHEKQGDTTKTNRPASAIECRYVECQSDLNNLFDKTYASSVYQNGPIRIISILGEAGIGKTVLTKQMAIAWARGNFHQFKLVFHIPITNLQPHHHLVDALVELNLITADYKRAVDEYLNKPETCKNVLFILDGIDDVRIHADSELGKLLSGRIYAESSKVVTLLPESNFEPISTIKVTLNGVSEETIRGYINQWFQKEKNNEVELFFEQNIDFDILRVPLYLVFICYIFSEEHRDDNSLSELSTTTGIFNSFMRVAVRRFLEKCSNVHESQQPKGKHTFFKNMIAEDEEESSLPVSAKRLLRKIAKMSFKSIIHNCQHFNKNMCKKYVLSPRELQETGLFVKVSAGDEEFKFAHKPLREYFTGLHLANKKNALTKYIFSESKSLQEEVDCDHFILKPNSQVIIFGCGISPDFFPNLLQVIKQANVSRFRHTCIFSPEEKMPWLDLYAETLYCAEAVKNFPEEEHALYQQLGEYFKWYSETVDCPEVHLSRYRNSLISTTACHAFETLTEKEKRQLLQKWFFVNIEETGFDLEKLEIKFPENSIFTGSYSDEIFISPLGLSLLYSFHRAFSNESIKSVQGVVFHPFLPRLFPWLKSITLVDSPFARIAIKRNDGFVCQMKLLKYLYLEKISFLPHKLLLSVLGSKEATLFTADLLLEKVSVLIHHPHLFSGAQNEATLHSQNLHTVELNIVDPLVPVDYLENVLKCFAKENKFRLVFCVWRVEHTHSSEEIVKSIKESLHICQINSQVTSVEFRFRTGSGDKEMVQLLSIDEIRDNTKHAQHSEEISRKFITYAKSLKMHLQECDSPPSSKKLKLDS